MVDNPLPGVQVAGSATLHQPAFARDRCQMRLAVGDAIELESRIRAEHESVDGLAVDEPTRHRFRFRATEQQHHFCGGQKVSGCFSGRDDRLFVYLRRNHDRLDASGSERRKPGGRGGGEVEAHVAPMLEEWATWWVPASRSRLPVSRTAASSSRVTKDACFSSVMRSLESGSSPRSRRRTRSRSGGLTRSRCWSQPTPAANMSGPKHPSTVLPLTDPEAPSSGISNSPLSGNSKRRSSANRCNGWRGSTST